MWVAIVGGGGGEGVVMVGAQAGTRHTSGGIIDDVGWGVNVGGIEGSYR